MSTSTKKTFGIFKNTDTDTAHWFVKLSRNGRRHSFDLGTNIKTDALKRAREIYLSLHANGWDVTLANFSVGATGGPPTTVGEFCDRFTKTFHGANRTANDYCQVLRRVSAHIAGISAPGKKYAGVSGYEKALEKINRLQLSILTRESIEAFRKSFVDRSGKDPLAQRSAKTTTNTYLRQLKAMFSAERLELLGLKDMTDPTAKIKPFKRADMRFQGGIDPVELFKAAVTELGSSSDERGPGSRTEQFKALTMMLCAGLRKNEADKLCWHAVKFDTGQLYIGTTKYLKPKNEKGDFVDLDPEIMALFRGWRAASPNDEFILKSDKKVRLNLRHNHYRASMTFSYLMDWLKTKGVADGKPLHTLRKLYGSMLNDRYGLHVASLGLRHSDIAITAQHYLSKRPSAPVGLGGVIAEAGKIVFFSDDAGEKPLVIDEAGKKTEKDLASNAG